MKHEVEVGLRDENLSGSVSAYYAECKWCRTWNKSLGFSGAVGFKIQMEQKECLVATQQVLGNLLQATL